jgi:hypothetical protein
LEAFRHGNCRRAEFRMPGCWDHHEASARSRTNPSGPRKRHRKCNAL